MNSTDTGMMGLTSGALITLKLTSKFCLFLPLMQTHLKKKKRTPWRDNLHAIKLMSQIKIVMNSRKHTH